MEARKTGDAPELKGLALLRPGNFDRSAKVNLCPIRASAFAQRDLALEAVKLRLMAAVPAFLRYGERLVERVVGIFQTLRVDQRIPEKPKIIGQGECRAGAPIGVETLYQPRERSFGMSS